MTTTLQPTTSSSQAHPFGVWGCEACDDGVGRGGKIGFRCVACGGHWSGGSDGTGSWFWSAGPEQKHMIAVYMRQDAAQGMKGK